MSKDNAKIERTRQETRETHKKHVDAVIVHTTNSIKSISDLLDKHSRT